MELIGTFVIWGALHGSFFDFCNYFCETLKKINQFIKNRNIFLNKIFDVSITFILVAFAWIFFRSNNIDDAIYVISNLNFNVTDY